MTSSDEKSGEITPPLKGEPNSIEVVESSSSSRELGFDEHQTKKLIRKIDWALLPFLALLYLLSFLDR
jgi:hypothetical protein